MTDGTQAFYLADGRAMVSLGPVSPKRHCPFRCPFCYVESPAFVKYDALSVADVVAWVEGRLSDVRVIYVSGDTDSFAPPRTAQGLSLLEALAELDRDLLFTTRYVFDSDDDWKRLTSIAARVRKAHRTPIACVSVCQTSQSRFEPPPIRPSRERIQQLGRLGVSGWSPVLAMRPILPEVPATDFKEILTLATPHTRYALTADYYFDPDSPQWRPANYTATQEGRLYFDIGTYANWQRITPSEDVMAVIRETAAQLGIQLFDRSDALCDLLCGYEGTTLP